MGQPHAHALHALGEAGKFARSFGLDWMAKMTTPNRFGRCAKPAERSGYGAQRGPTDESRYEACNQENAGVLAFFIHEEVKRNEASHAAG